MSILIIGRLVALLAASGIEGGGNRIACTLNYNRAGFDLVHLADGRMRLAVNEWPDWARDDSSPGRLREGEWPFFAVTYDSTRDADNVRWYFGSQDQPAELDTTVTYNRGATGEESGPTSVGNYNEPLHRHGLDRQFRGSLRGLRVFGSRVSSKGALSLERAREEQALRWNRNRLSAWYGRVGRGRCRGGWGRRG